MPHVPKLNLPLIRRRRPPLDVSRIELIDPGNIAHIVTTIREWARYVDQAFSSADAQMFAPRLSVTSGANPTLGSGGSSAGWFTRSGDAVFYQFVLSFAGGGIEQGSGTYQISLPIVPRRQPSSSLISRGLITVDDDSVGRRRFSAHIGATHLFLRPINATAYAADTDVTDATIGLTFASGDSISGQVQYLA